MIKQTTKNIKTLNQTIDGKLPPQALELEEAILGALMLDNEALSDTIDILKPEYFYKLEHQKIFNTVEMAELYVKVASTGKSVILL